MEYVTIQKTLTIHMRGIVDAETFTPMVVNNLTIRGQYVTFADAEGRQWKTELSEVSAIIVSVTDKQLACNGD